MAKITKVKAPKKDEIHSYVIAGDWHTDALDIPTYEILIKVAKNIPKNQRRLIINGDFLDVVHLMGKKTDYLKWAKCVDIIEEELIPLTEDELAWGNKTLDELQKVFDHIYFIEGNHDWRYRAWSEYCPHAYRYNFNYKEILRLKERGITFVAHNNWLDVGELAITHGIWHGATALKKHYEDTGKNVIFSHVHHADSKSFVSRGKTRKAWSLPSMSNLNPDYTKNRDNNWSNGFGVFHVKSNGHFNMNIFETWDGELVYPNGKLING